MVIEKDKVVTLHYKLNRDNAEGDLVEQTHGSEPLTFLYGAGQMIPKFESELEGKKAGDSFEFGIKSEEAYGDYNPEAVISIPKDTFVVDGQLADDLLVIGKTIPMRDQDGRQLIGTVKEIEGDAVTMDFNHPMAGTNLYFSGEIEEVRAATESELDHGHVHGPGGEEH